MDIQIPQPNIKIHNTSIVALHCQSLHHLVTNKVTFAEEKITEMMCQQVEQHDPSTIERKSSDVPVANDAAEVVLPCNNFCIE